MILMLLVTCTEEESLGRINYLWFDPESEFYSRGFENGARKYVQSQFHKDIAGNIWGFSIMIFRKIGIKYSWVLLALYPRSISRTSINTSQAPMISSEQEYGTLLFRTETKLQIGVVST